MDKKETKTTYYRVYIDDWSKKLSPFSSLSHAKAVEIAKVYGKDHKVRLVKVTEHTVETSEELNF